AASRCRMRRTGGACGSTSSPAVRTMSRKTRARIVALHGSGRRAFKRVEIDVVGRGGWGRAGALSHGGEAGPVRQGLTIRPTASSVRLRCRRLPLPCRPRRLAALTALRDELAGVVGVFGDETVHGRLGSW